MNPRLVRALIDQRQLELRRTARRAPREPSAAPAPGLRHRLGILLVEAGLHLITRVEGTDRPRLSSPVAR